MIIRASVYLLFIITLAGCLATKEIPEKDLLGSATTIEIIPIEAPYLEQAPKSKTKEEQAIMSSLSMLPEYYVQPNNWTMTQLNNGWSIAKIKNITIDNVEISNLQDSFSNDGKWSPTVELAEKAELFISTNPSVTVNPVTHYYLLPPGKRKASWDLGEWFGPIKHWYGEDASSTDYKNIVLRMQTWL